MTNNRRKTSGQILIAAALLTLSATHCRCREPVRPDKRARAYRIETVPAEIFGDTAVAAPGDFVLANSHVIAVVSDANARSGFGASGGNLVDLVRIPGGMDRFNEVFLYLNDEFPRQALYDTVVILQPNGNGEARVRASGVDSHDPQIKIETDYILAPESHWVTLQTRFTMTGTRTVERFALGDAVQWGQTKHMAPSYGFALPGKRAQLDWVGSVGRGCSYAMVPDGSGQFDTRNGEMWSDPMGAIVDLTPNAPVTYRRHFLVGLGDTACLSDAIAKLRGDSVGNIEGRVLHRGQGVKDAMILLVDAKGKTAGTAATDADGNYRIALRAGSYRARAEAPGRASVQSSTTTFILVREEQRVNIDFAMGEKATLEWKITDPEGAALPVRLTFVGIDDTPSPVFGPSFAGDGAENMILSKHGHGTRPVRPGRYRVIATRGPEYERLEARLQLIPGETVSFEGVLPRAFETPGLIAADLHQHSAPSFDSGVSVVDRVIANAAEGVEVAVATEHNALVDYAPYIETLGLTQWVTSVVGVEATTHSVGHFNAFPLVRDGTKKRGGYDDPEGKTPDEIFTELHSFAPNGGTAFIQVNHPRARRNGYFRLMNVDPKTGLSDDPRWDDGFDGFEAVMFGEAKETKSILDVWRGFLGRGLRKTLTGNSDSHTIALRVVGWPRTYVCSEAGIDTLNPQTFADTLRRGCATISAGPVAQISSGTHGMGSLVAAPKPRVEIDVQVQAASWVATDKLQILVNGLPRQTIPLSSQAVERYEGKHTITCKRDCAVSVWVEGELSLAPLITPRRDLDPRPFALTNPIYFDRDGDGQFNP